MNFFEHQDQARKNTRKLIFLFALSLLFITVTVYLAAVVTLSSSFKGSKRSSRYQSIECSQSRPPSSGSDGSSVPMPCTPIIKKATFNWWNPSLFFTIGGGTVVLVGLGSLYKIQTLKAGGSVIAQEMGGRLLLSEMAHPEERQLLNVVEEMAIAAGISVPAVYVMDGEQGINAFAAGFTPNDAVIGVTRGTLELLSRDELQGVIGHEFSHILNGDMRLNIRLIGILHGLLLIYITGRVVIDWRPRNKEGNAVLVFGIALVVIGSFGLLCGRLIKSAISRQREFLADASSVQFTRNPAGIAGALDKISSHHHHALIHTPAAESNSHLFFGSALRFNFLEELFATHPPLEQRIRRLDASKRQYAGQTPTFSGNPAGQESLTMGFASGGAVARSPHIQADPAQVVEQIGTVTPEHYAYAKALLGQLPESLQSGIREPQGAIAIVYGLLLDTQNLAVRTKQLEWLKQVEPADVIEKTLALSADIDALDPRSRLPLVDLTVPVLRQSDIDQHQRLFKCIQGLANADGRWSLSEFVLYAVLRHRLQPSPNAAIAPTTEFTTIGQIWSDCLLLLSGLAQVGQTGAEAITYAFRSGVYRLPGAGQETLPDAPPACNMKTLKQSIDRLNLATPKLKQAIVDACAHTVLLDNKVTVQEAELLRAIVILLDCPMPPFLNTGSKMIAKGL